MEARPLVITDDDEMLDELLRIAAAAGTELSHARAPESPALWRAADLVLIDARQVRAAVLAGLPRRRGVVAVADSPPDGETWEYCVVLGVERTVLLATADAELIELLAESRDAGPGGGRVLGVVGAGRGAGGSVLAAAVAVAAVRSGSGVVLVDCDEWGPGLDVLLGLEDDPGLRWEDFATPSDRVPFDALHGSLPTLFDRPFGRGGRPPRGGRSEDEPRGLSVLAGGRSGHGGTATPEGVDLMLSSARRGGALAVVDLPRGPGGAADRAVDGADLIALVVTADVPCVYGAQRVIRRLADRGADLGLVVRGPSPGGLAGADLSEILEVPLLAQMRPQPHLARDLEWGRPPGSDPRGPLARAAAQVLDAVRRGE